MRISQSNKNPGLLIQGSLLAGASLLSRLIGLIYRIPMTNIIGDAGNNYYACAFDLFNIMLILSSFGLPSAVCELVSARLAKDQKKEAYRVFKAALIFALVIGTCAALILWCASGFLTSTFMKTPDSIFALRVLCPVLILVSLLGVFRGFFQGLGTARYTAVSQIIEQIINAAVSIWAACMLFEYGRKAGNVLGNPSEYEAAFSAAGGTLGTAAGAAAGLVTMIIVFLVFGRQFRLEVKAEDPMEKDSLSYLFRSLLFAMVPAVIAALCCNISGILDQAVFKNIALLQGYTEDTICIWWGVFAGKYKVLSSIPIVLATAIAMSLLPSVTHSHIVHDKEEESRQMEKGFRFVIIAALPSAAVLGIYARPIVSMLFFGQPDTVSLAVHMLRVGIPAMVFYPLAVFSISLLHGIGHSQEAVRNAVIAIFAHLLLLVLLMLFLRISIFAVVIANILFSVLLFGLNMHEICRHTSFRFSVMKIISKPFVSAFMMSVISAAVYIGIDILSGNSTASFVCAFITAVIIYLLVIFLTRSISESEIEEMPIGGSLADILRKLHLL